MTDAETRIAALEQQLAQLLPVTLLSQQIEAFTEALKATQGNAFLVVDGLDAGAVRLKAQLAPAFIEAGWNVRDGGSHGRTAAEGLIVLQPPEDDRNPSETALVAALEAAGIAYATEQGGHETEETWLFFVPRLPSAEN
jgi:hypothetical protein